MAKDERNKKRTLPFIESVDLDKKILRPRANIANFNKLSSISNLAVDN